VLILEIYSFDMFWNALLDYQKNLRLVC